MKIQILTFALFLSLFANTLKAQDYITLNLGQDTPEQMEKSPIDYGHTIAIDNCDCSKPFKEQKRWLKGSRGGFYCLNSKGNKRYFSQWVKSYGKPRMTLIESPESINHSIVEGTCNCATPFKENKQWAKGSRGGYFCLNAKGNKRYFGSWLRSHGE